MEIRHLKLIQVVARTKSLTRAAENLFVSQSALSHQLKELEEELGTQVFVRARRQMLLTPAGKRLLKTADQVLCALEKVETEIGHMSREDAGLLRMTTGCYTCYHWLSRVLGQYQDQFPEVEFDILPEATYQPISYLLEGKLDLVLTSDYEENANLQYQLIFTDQLVCLLHPDHALRSHVKIEAKDFETQALIMYRVPDQNSLILNEFLKPAGVQPKKLLRLQLTEAIIEMVKAGMGVGILADWAIRPYVERGEILRKPLSPRVERNWYAVTLKNRDRPRYLKAFIELLQRETLNVLKKS